MYTDDDVDYAVFLSRVFTQALLHKMQTDMRSKILNKQGAGFKQTMDAQLLQVKAAAKGIGNVTYPPRKVDAIQHTIAQRAREIALMTNAAAAAAAAPAAAAGSTITDIANKFQEVEAKMKQQQQQQAAVKAKEQQKQGATKNKMKNMLQSYKVAKQGGGSSNGKDGKDDKQMSPIELLRNYHISGKRPQQDGNLLWFGDISYPTDTVTNFVKHSDGGVGYPEYYELGTLNYFLKYVQREHSTYLRRAREDNVSTVKKQDRNNLMSYLSGNRAHVASLAPKTHRELNPHLFGGSGDDRKEVGATAAAQKRPCDPWTGDGVNSKRKSRFDEPCKVGPNFGQQQKQSQPQPQAVVSATSAPLIASPWAATQQQQVLQQVQAQQQAQLQAQQQAQLRAQEQQRQAQLQAQQAQLRAQEEQRQAQLQAQQQAQLRAQEEQRKAQMQAQQQLSQLQAQRLAQQQQQQQQQQYQQMPPTSTWSGAARASSKAMDELDRVIESEKARKASSALVGSASSYQSSAEKQPTGFSSDFGDYDRRSAERRSADRSRSRDRDREERASSFDSRRAMPPVDKERSQYLQSAGVPFQLNEPKVAGFSSNFDSEYGSRREPSYGRSASMEPPKAPPSSGRWVSEDAAPASKEVYDPLQPTPSSPGRAMPQTQSWGFRPTSNQKQSSSSSIGGFEKDLAPPAPVLSGFSSSFSFSSSDGGQQQQQQQQPQQQQAKANPYFGQSNFSSGGNPRW